MALRYSIFISMMLFSTQVWTQSVTIVESDGWFESAYVKWQAVDGADSYNVYLSGEGISDKQIDNQLIRDYGTYYRTDVLGIKAGTYTIKVAAVISGSEDVSATTGSLVVEAYDRTGFAFANSRVPGAYNADGTPKANAVVLYITENTKNICSMDVNGANENPCIGLQTILEGYKKGDETRPLIVRLLGQITDLEYMNKGDIVIENDNNTSSYITFEGVGNDAVADGWGIRLKNASNIEIRNIGLMNCDSDEGDNIGLQQGNDHIWVHQNDFFYGDAGSDSDQAKGDGALDSKKSTYVTHSYNHFWDSGKSNLLGNGGEDVGFFTYHHNWYDHSDSRHPRVREHTVHVYNNYFDGIAKYGIGATTECSIFADNNYFRNCKYPMLTSNQGTDVYGDNDGTFSGDPGGMIKAYANYIVGANRFVDQTEYASEFDAYVVINRNDEIPASVTTVSGGHTYNNFDTDAEVMYAYTPDSPEEAKTKVMQYSGRMNGGDFDWTFNNTVDDTDYEVNTALKAALVNYQTELVSVQGDTTASGGGTSGGGTGGGGTGGGEITGDLVHNFTTEGKTSSYFSITGNLSDSKGTVSYAGLTLTQCLKIESSTTIDFTTSEEATISLVFNNDFSGDIKINGTSYTASGGIVTLTIAAGSYQITKNDIANLYYISILYSNTGMKFDEDAGIILYPNPVTNILNISCPDVIKDVELINLTGIIVKRVITNTNTIDLQDLEPGFYLVKVSREQGIFTQIIIKE